MKFLKKELEKIVKIVNRPNIHLAEWSMTTIWGGASLLQMHLKVMNELLKFKKSKNWSWDFLLNLSETDFPVK
jgi:protein xylosyltransferase